MYFNNPMVSPSYIPAGHVRSSSYLASGQLGSYPTPAHGVNYMPAGSYYVNSPIQTSYIGGAPSVYGAGVPIQTSMIKRSVPLRRTGEYPPITHEEVMAKIRDVQKEVSDEEKRDVYKVGSTTRSYKENPIRIEDSGYSEHLQMAENIFDKYRNPYDKQFVNQIMVGNNYAPTQILTREEFESRTQRGNEFGRAPEGAGYQQSISLVESKIIEDTNPAEERRALRAEYSNQNQVTGGPYYQSYQYPSIDSSAVAQQQKINQSQAKLSKILPKYPGVALNEGVLVQGGVMIDIPSLFNVPPQEIIFQGYSTDEDKRN